MRRPKLTAAAAEAAVVLIAIGLAFAAGAAGWAIGHSSSSSSGTAATVTVAGSEPDTTATSTAKINPKVASGGHIFVQFACAQCHGEQGKGGVSPDVPALKTIGKTLSAAKLRQIIDHGLGESANPTKPYMPVWGEVISTTQVSDLIAYLHAGLPEIPTADPPVVPKGQGAAVAGAALYVRYGCINCHGPNGLGGVANPLSPDKSIPPLSGQDFRHEFNTDKKIADVIRSGSVIGKAPIVSMPHWGGILSATQISQLIAYLKTLK